MRRIRHITLLATALTALAIPASASANWRAVVRDCADDSKLDHHYSHSDLKHAREHLPTDIKEYTDCESVIAAALRGESSGGGGPGAGGNPALTTPPGATAGSPQDLSALRSERARGRGGHSPTVKVGGQALRPASSGLNHLTGAANSMPTPLLVAIAAVAALCAAGGIAAAWRRWPALVRAPLRLLRR
jgi:hypothetical protein